MGVYIHNDSVPEGAEKFWVELLNPRGGAEVAQESKLAVNILSNDDGHGIIEFDEV